MRKNGLKMNVVDASTTKLSRFIKYGGTITRKEDGMREKIQRNDYNFRRKC